MTGANSGVTSNGGGDASTSHCKGHRRQESMYAMTGLYSESVPEDNDGTADTKCSTTFCHDTVIKCHSRNPSAGFDRFGVVVVSKTFNKKNHFAETKLHMPQHTLTHHL
jgi:hypothetical protein